MLDVVGTPIGTMQALLGHSAPEITREIYLHAIPEEQRRAVESVERLVFGPKLDPSLGSSAEMSETVHLKKRRKWSGRRDLNSGPPAPKAGALPGCATPRHARLQF